MMLMLMKCNAIMEAKHLRCYSYCDANWISDADELYATSGYVFLLGSGVVS
jgi:hypothetical protein